MPLESLNNKEVLLMVFNYQKDRIKCLEKREKWYVLTLVIVVCAFAGVKIGML